jgi:hypothetical protein
MANGREAELTGIIRRALASRGKRRVGDLREALSLAVELSGQGSDRAPSYYEKKDRIQATNEAADLRELLLDPSTAAASPRTVA